MKKIIYLVIIFCSVTLFAFSQEVKKPLDPPNTKEVIPERPSEHHVWIDGQWGANNDGYFWIPGKWVVEVEDHVWVSGKWKRRPSGWFAWTPGYWKPESTVSFSGGLASNTDRNEFHANIQKFIAANSHLANTNGAEKTNPITNLTQAQEMLLELFSEEVLADMNEIEKSIVLSIVEYELQTQQVAENR